MTLTKKELAFVDLYFESKMNGTEAYQALYPNSSYDAARMSASRLIAKARVKEAIEAKLIQVSNRTNDNILKMSILGLPALVRKAIPDKVYFVLSENKLIKIGIASNVTQRVNDLNIASPVQLVLLFYIQADNARQLEKSFHVIFSSKRVKGEWFNLTDEDLNWVKNNHVIDC